MLCEDALKLVGELNSQQIDLFYLLILALFLILLCAVLYIYKEC